MEIKTNVPIPEKSISRKAKYPFADMEPGDSLSISDTETFERARRAASSYAKRHGVSFTSRANFVDSKPAKGGGTIWRQQNEGEDTETL